MSFAGKIDSSTAGATYYLIVDSECMDGHDLSIVRSSTRWLRANNTQSQGRPGYYRYPFKPDDAILTQLKTWPEFGQEMWLEAMIDDTGKIVEVYP